MSLISNLFKSSKKTNLTPDVTIKAPYEINPQAYGDLSKLSHNYINGVGTGFGEDFMNQASNGPVNAMRRNFQNVTSPFISGQFSSRGLGKSSLAANAQGLAQGNVESDIGNLMSQFYLANKQQEKSDQSTGINVGQNLLSGDVSAQHAQADASERLANATAADSRARQTADTAKAGQLMQAGAQMAVPALGGLSSLSGMAGMNGLKDIFSKMQGGMQTFNSASGARQQVLGSDEMDSFMQAYKAMKGLK